MTISPTLTARKKQTQAARDAFNSRFNSPDEKSSYFRQLGRQAAAQRFVLPADEAATLVSSLSALENLTRVVGSIAERLEAQRTGEGNGDA